MSSTICNTTPQRRCWWESMIPCMQLHIRSLSCRVARRASHPTLGGVWPAQLPGFYGGGKGSGTAHTSRVEVGSDDHRPSPSPFGIGRARADPGRRDPALRIVCMADLVAALSRRRPSHEPLVAEASNQGQSKVSGSRNPNMSSAFQGEPPKCIIGLVRRCHSRQFG